MGVHFLFIFYSVQGVGGAVAGGNIGGGAYKKWGKKIYIKKILCARGRGGSSGGGVIGGEALLLPLRRS